MLLVSLIGDQPIPNLLPIRHLNPKGVLLVQSERTRPAADRLASLLPAGCTPIQCEVDAYDILACKRCLEDAVGQAGESNTSLLFNITGGTKPMSLAAYEVAQAMRAPFAYLQTEGRRTRLYRYQFDAEGAPRHETSDLLPDLITIRDYLRAYLGDGFQITGIRRGQKGTAFEEAVRDALRPVVDEVLYGLKSHGGQIDVDLVVRCGNQVGIIEAKDEGPGKKGIDQLNSAGEQRFLGTYTARMLASSHAWPARLGISALARAHRIAVIELLSFTKEHPSLSPEDVADLQRAVCRQLGKELP